MAVARVYDMVVDWEVTMVALPVVVKAICEVLRLENELAGWKAVSMVGEMANA